jgi:Protein of unknown function (DUF3108)
MKHTLLTFLLSLIFGAGHVVGQCFEKNTTFGNGEFIQYEIKYNWGLLWLNAGTASFEVDSMAIAGKPAYHFESLGKSHKAYDWFFKVRDYYDAWAFAENIHPYKFSRITSEGGNKKDNFYKFDYLNKKIYSKRRNKEKTFSHDTLTLPACTYDVLSATYATRNIDFSKMAPMDTLPIRMILDNEIFEIYIRYHGREIVKLRDGSRYRCIKFTALLVEGSIFKGGEDLTVWVSDDQNKIPVKVEAKILVGSVKVFLTEARNLRYPLRSRIE